MPIQPGQAQVPFLFVIKQQAWQSYTQMESDRFLVMP
jgi:hypothetical protein